MLRLRSCKTASQRLKINGSTRAQTESKLRKVKQLITIYMAWPRKSRRMQSTSPNRRSRKRTIYGLWLSILKKSLRRSTEAIGSASSPSKKVTLGISPPTPSPKLAPSTPPLVRTGSNSAPSVDPSEMQMSLLIIKVTNLTAHKQISRVVAHRIYFFTWN